MPKGKGTYGSQVGRPPKKQKYQDGGLLKGKSHEEGGIPILAEGGEVIINKNMNNAAGMHEDELLALNENPEDYAIIPISNAMERSQTMPDVTEYGDGGKVSVGEETRKLNYEATEATIKRMKKNSLAGKHFKPTNPYKRQRDKDKK